MDPKKVLRRCWEFVVGIEIVISLAVHGLDFVEKVHTFLG